MTHVEPEAPHNEPRVYRPTPSAVWRMTNAWGPNLGDNTEFSVTRTPGHSLKISYGRESVVVPEKLLPWFADAVARAAAWQDPMRWAPVAETGDHS